MAKDPYQYFRVEARELVEVLGRGVLDLENREGGGDLVIRMLRSAHTLKGAARVVKQAEIAKRAHAVEDVLTPFREQSGEIGPPQIEELLRHVDEITTLVAALDLAPARRADAGDVAAEPLKYVRVELREMDALFDDIVEVDVRLTAIRRNVEGLAQAQALGDVRELRAALAAKERELLVALEHADREMSQLRARANQLRLVPAQTIFTSLERGVRDVAQSLERPVRFEATGGEQQLDANVLGAMRDALLHVVRNAVAHGIEPETERLARGKSAVGCVSIDVQRRDHRVVFTCRDDGRGIDTEAVRRAASDRGVMSASEAAALGTDQLLRLILRSGVTTAASVTELSGRGVGLDAVQAAVVQLGGDLAVASEPGRGTSISLSVPISLSSLVALVVEASGIAAALPLDSVRRTVRVTAADVASSAEHDAIMVDGRAIPFLPLVTALRRALPPSRRAEPWSAVVLESSGRLGAIGVDRLLATSNVVLRPLPRLAGAAPAVLGASLDAEGNPQIILDPSALVRAAHAGRGAIVDVPAVERPPVLVIDDSLTTRMLEQSILESAGYDVELATSAEEGLELARHRRYSLFIVDVEMPGMNGFDFLETVRADRELRQTPAILVTSRSSGDDKQRGVQAGARAYIVKSEFHQGRLLETIRELVG